MTDSAEVAIRPEASARRLFDWLISGQAIGLAFVVPVVWIQLFYYNVRANENLTYQALDAPLGVKVQADQAFGFHYFGDYLLPWKWAEHANPWVGLKLDNPYPPLPMMMFKVFTWLPYRASLLIYLGLSLLALVIPAVIAARKLSARNGILLITLGAVLTAPTAIGLDRGNYIVFLTPLLFAFLIAIVLEKYRWAAALLVAMTCWKIYPVLLVVLLLGRRKYLLSVLAGTASVVLTLALFAVYPGGVVASVKGWMGGLVQFSAPTLENLSSGNFSMAGLFASVAQWLEGVAPGVGSVLESNPWLPGLLYFVGVAVVVLLDRIDSWSCFALAASTVQLVSPLTYAYASVFALVLLPVAVMYPRVLHREVPGTKPTATDGEPAARRRLLEPHQLVIVLAILVTTIPLMFRFDGATTLAKIAVPVGWLIALVSCLIASRRRARSALTLASADVTSPAPVPNTP